MTNIGSSECVITVMHFINTKYFKMWSDKIYWNGYKFFISEKQKEWYVKEPLPRPDIIVNMGKEE